MGWGSAVHIMDTAVTAAESTVKAAFNAGRDSAGFQPLAWPRRHTDDLLRPFVRTLAAHLRDGDWDTIEDSEFFDRFPQEMLGHDNAEHEEWLIRKVIDSEADAKWVEKLTDFRTHLAEGDHDKESTE